MKKPTRKQIEAAQKLLEDAGYIIGSLFQLDDIIQYGADDMKPPIKITKKQAREIACLMNKRHDCNNGFNWEFMRYCIEEYFEGG